MTPSHHDDTVPSVLGVPRAECSLLARKCLVISELLHGRILEWYICRHFPARRMVSVVAWSWKALTPGILHSTVYWQWQRSKVTVYVCTLMGTQSAMTSGSMLTPHTSFLLGGQRRMARHCSHPKVQKKSPNTACSKAYRSIAQCWLPSGHFCSVLNGTGCYNTVICTVLLQDLVSGCRCCMLLHGGGGYNTVTLSGLLAGSFW